MFWDNLHFPIVGLSPMDGVTDAPMRFMAKKYGQADIIYTEFVSAEGLWRIKKKGEMDHKIWKDLLYDESERPIIAQLFGSDPDSFFEAAKIVCELGLDGIDINMGCPSPGLEKRGGGAGLMKDQGLAAAVIEATRTAAGKVPVSVKTRIGSSKPDESWWRFLAEQKLPAVAMHGRTFKQLYKGEADWKILLRAGEIIRESGTKFLGNGDVAQISVRSAQKSVLDLRPLSTSADQAPCLPAGRRAAFAGTSVPIEFAVLLKNGEEIDLTGKVDGVLIGREAIGNPWTLQKVSQPCLPAGRCHSDTVTPKERLMVMVEHAYKYQEILGRDCRVGVPPRNDGSKFQFFPMRKHLACYARGFEGSGGLRKKLMTAENAEQVEIMIEEFFSGR